MTANFGHRLRTVRERNGITQEGLALRCGLIACHVNHFEAGRRLPSLDSFCKLARVFPGDIKYLLGLV